MKVCDIDNSSEGLEEVGVGAVNDPDAGLTVAANERPLCRFDVCKPCREALKHGGVEALVERYEQARGRRRRRKPDDGG